MKTRDILLLAGAGVLGYFAYQTYKNTVEPVQKILGGTGITLPSITMPDFSWVSDILGNVKSVGDATSPITGVENVLNQWGKSAQGIIDDITDQADDIVQRLTDQLDNGLFDDENRINLIPNAGLNLNIIASRSGGFDEAEAYAHYLSGMADPYGFLNIQPGGTVQMGEDVSYQEALDRGIISGHYKSLKTSSDITEADKKALKEYESEYGEITIAPPEPPTPPLPKSDTRKTALSQSIFEEAWV